MKYITALALPLLAAAQTLDTNAVKITSVTYSGNGCPQGSATSMISDDRTVSLPTPSPQIDVFEYIISCLRITDSWNVKL